MSDTDMKKRYLRMAGGEEKSDKEEKHDKEK